MRPMIKKSIKAVMKKNFVIYFYMIIKRCTHFISFFKWSFNLNWKTKRLLNKVTVSLIEVNKKLILLMIISKEKV